MTNPPVAALPPSDPATFARSRRRYVPGLARTLVGGAVLAALVVMSIPAFSETSGRAGRIKALAQAKQIGLALKLFASDNDGTYPTEGTPITLKNPTTSNAAFAALFPTYITSEMIFGDPTSAYQTRTPDNKIGKASADGPDRTLETGENVYSYMMGLTDAANPGCPLVMDGTDGTGHYTADATRLGGVGAGVNAIVIHLDDSGVLERLVGPATALYVPLGKPLADALGGKPDGNLLDAALYGKGVKLLDPAH